MPAFRVIWKIDRSGQYRPGQRLSQLTQTPQLIATLFDADRTIPSIEEFA
jgi:hypothetical protein